MAEDSKGLGGSLFDLGRRLVSKKKNRFRVDGFDLDLTYITDQVIAMGFPSQGMESTYRNPIGQVKRFFETRHSGNYKIYNLCSERSYDPKEFHGKVSHFPFDDHNCPELTLLKNLCDDIHEWLQGSPERVVGIHCKAGKGRTGVIIGCYLVHTGWPAQGALDHFGKMRTANGKGVTIPSQKRYVHYYGKLMQSKTPAERYAWNGDVPLKVIALKTISFSALPKSVTKATVETVYFQAFDIEGKVLLSSRKARNAIYNSATKTLDFLCDDFSKIPLSKDIKIMFCSETKAGRKTKLFQFWFHTSMVPEGNVLTLAKDELDGAVKDKGNKEFQEDFQVELSFVELEGSSVDLARRRGYSTEGDIPVGATEKGELRRDDVSEARNRWRQSASLRRAPSPIEEGDAVTSDTTTSAADPAAAFKASPTPPPSPPAKKSKPDAPVVSSPAEIEPMSPPTATSAMPPPYPAKRKLSSPSVPPPPVPAHGRLMSTDSLAGHDVIEVDIEEVKSAPFAPPKFITPSRAPPPLLKRPSADVVPSTFEIFVQEEIVKLKADQEKLRALQTELDADDDIKEEIDPSKSPMLAEAKARFEKASSDNAIAVREVSVLDIRIEAVRGELDNCLRAILTEATALKSSAREIEKALLLIAQMKTAYETKPEDAPSAAQLLIDYGKLKDETKEITRLLTAQHKANYVNKDKNTTLDTLVAALTGLWDKHGATLDSKVLLEAEGVVESTLTELLRPENQAIRQQGPPGSRRPTVLRPPARTMSTFSEPDAPPMDTTFNLNSWGEPRSRQGSMIWIDLPPPPPMHESPMVEAAAKWIKTARMEATKAAATTMEALAKRKGDAAAQLDATTEQLVASTAALQARIPQLNAELRVLLAKLEVLQDVPKPSRPSMSPSRAIILSEIEALSTVVTSLKELVSTGAVYTSRFNHVDGLFRRMKSIELGEDESESKDALKYLVESLRSDAKSNSTEITRLKREGDDTTMALRTDLQDLDKKLGVANNSLAVAIDTNRALQSKCEILERRLQEAEDRALKLEKSTPSVDTKSIAEHTIRIPSHLPLDSPTSSPIRGLKTVASNGSMAFDGSENPAEIEHRKGLRLELKKGLKGLEAKTPHTRRGSKLSRSSFSMGEDPEALLTRQRHIATTLKQWRASVPTQEIIECEPEEIGRLRSDTCYIFFHFSEEGMVGSKQSLSIYFWVGADSKPAARASASVNAQNLASKLQNIPQIVRLVDGDESDDFLALFQGELKIIRTPEYGSSEFFVPPSVQAMFRISGISESAMSMKEVDFQVSSLDSRHCFVVFSSSYLYVWSGVNAREAEARVACSFANKYKGGGYRKGGVALEGEEPSEFWNCFDSGKGVYANIPFDDGIVHVDDSEASLFRVSNFADSSLEVEEVYDYSREDLFGVPVAILHTNKEVFIWIGSSSSNETRDLAFSVGERYLITNTAEDVTLARSKPLIRVFEGHEPSDFTKHFPDFNNASTSDPLERGLLHIKRSMLNVFKEGKAVADNSPGLVTGPRSSSRLSRSSISGETPKPVSSRGESPGKGIAAPLHVDEVTPLDIIEKEYAKSIQNPGAGVKRDSATKSPTTDGVPGKVVPVGSSYFSYVELKNRCRLPVDMAVREQYLTDDEFAVVFKMNRAQFAKLPFWKQKNLKTSAALF